MKYVLMGIAAVIAICGLTWIFQGNDFLLYRYFAPKEEAVRRTTFEQSKAYNEGVAQELRQAKLDFARAKTREEKQAIASYALHEAGGYDRTKLPPDLADFMVTLEEAVAQ